MEKQKITVEELSVLVWLKLLQDFEMVNEFGDKVTALVDKIERFDITTAEIEPQFFYDTVEKFKGMGLMTNDFLSDKGVKVAMEVLENPKFENEFPKLKDFQIAIETSVNEIKQFIIRNRDEIILSLTFLLLEVVFL